MSRLLHHPSVGDILIVKKLSIRNIRLSVHSIKGIRVSIPWHISYSTAERFLEEKREWILKVLERQRIKNEANRIELKEGSVIKLITKTIYFREERSNGEINVITQGDSKIVCYPADCPNDKLKEAATVIIRKEAHRYLPVRLQELAHTYSLSYNRLSLRNNISNWGSCSQKKNINLNIHLMRLPLEICDYVIKHELCHLIHPNHKQQFHQMLNKMCDNREKELKNKLRQYTPAL